MNDFFVLLDHLTIDEDKENSVSEIVKVTVSKGDAFEDFNLMIGSFHGSVAVRECETVVDVLFKFFEGFKGGFESLVQVLFESEL